jgi:hypothetical protein
MPLRKVNEGEWDSDEGEWDSAGEDEILQQGGWRKESQGRRAKEVYEYVPLQLTRYFFVRRGPAGPRRLSPAQAQAISKKSQTSSQ